MPQSHTLSMGLDAPKGSIAVAYVAKDHAAAVSSLGTIGTRHGDIATLIRTRQSHALRSSWDPHPPSPRAMAPPSLVKREV